MRRKEERRGRMVLEERCGSICTIKSRSGNMITQGAYTVNEIRRREDRG